MHSIQGGPRYGAHLPGSPPRRALGGGPLRAAGVVAKVVDHGQVVGRRVRLKVAQLAELLAVRRWWCDMVVVVVVVVVGGW